MKAHLKRYKNAKQIMWCQEEPKNQGAWAYMSPILHELAGPDQALKVVARPASASPAVGYYQKHIEQLQSLVNEALGDGLK